MLQSFLLDRKTKSESEIARVTPYFVLRSKLSHYYLKSQLGIQVVLFGM